MLYLDVAMSCFDYATCYFVGILSISILVHKIVGTHFLSGMIVVLLGDVGGGRK